MDSGYSYIIDESSASRSTLPKLAMYNIHGSMTHSGAEFTRRPDSCESPGAAQRIPPLGFFLL